MKKHLLILALSALLLPVMATGIEFDRDSLRLDPDQYQASYPACREIAVGSGLILPGRELLVPLGNQPLTALDWTTEPEPAGSVDKAVATAVPTSAEQRYESLLDNTSLPGYRPVDVIGVETIDQDRYARVLLFPLTVSPDGSLTWHNQITFSLGGDVVDDRVIVGRNPGSIVNRPAGASAGLSGDGDYVIITAESMAPALARLANHRRRTGFDVTVTTVETIEASYSGADPAEQIRNYLTDFYAAGGRYVLLAGDETLVPNRLTYQYNTTGSPDPALLQPSDLYFADLSGDWDADRDGVYGERTQDTPDFTAELLVGRLPLNDSLQFERYTDNLIAYETDPGHGDRDWLTNSLFYSSDQLRDYTGGGQHALIAEVFPSDFAIDTMQTIEQATGDAHSPSNLAASELGQALSDASGIVNILAHGRSDGFVVRSAGYNEWPKSYLLIAEEAGAHGSFDSLLHPAKPSLYISLACDNGGYDLGPVGAEERSVVQVLLSREGGAVGFIGNTRWGWVGSSYLLHRTILQSIFASPEQTVASALQAARDTYPYYRDLIYGLNYFGDPALRIYTKQPKQIETTISGESVLRELRVTIGSSPAADARVTMIDQQGSKVFEGTTGADGTISLGWLPEHALYDASVSKDNCVTNLFEIAPSIVTDIDDDPSSLPTRFSLHQNYPNPFNPSTVISYALPRSQQVRLTVVNILGREVTTLVDRSQAAGQYDVSWDALDAAGNRCASGVYFYRLETDEYVAVRKMLLVR